MRKLALILWALIAFLPTIAVAQPITKLCYTNSSGGCTTASSANPFPVTGTFSGSVTVVFPTVGAAVPATAIYNAINVAGTLRGVTGLSLGSTFSQTVAIVDASGNQITSFGSSAAVGTTGAAVPASASYSGLNVGGTLRGATALGLGSTFSQTVAIVDASGVQITSFGGGGGAVTIADGADVTQGAIVDAAYTSGDGTVISILKGIYASASGDVPSVTGPLNAATAAATKSLMIGGQYLSSAPTMTNTQQGAFLLDVNGNLKVNVITATGLAQGSTTASQTGSLIMGAVTTAAPSYTTAQTSPLSLDTGGALRVSGTVTIASDTNTTPVVSASAESSHVLKASAGTLYGVYATNLTSTAGFLLVFNATSAPGDGAVTPTDCVALPPTGTANIGRFPGPARAYSTGITAVVSSATTCFTKTTGTITAFISGDVK